jgi:hypothetical protein
MMKNSFIGDTNSRILMRVFLVVAACVVPLLVSPTSASVPDPSCDVTTGLDGDPGIPQYLIVGMNELVTKDDLTPEEFAEHEAREYGENGLWMGLPEDGVLRGGDIHVTPEGFIEWRKFGFYRDDSARGEIQMKGTRRNDLSATFVPHLPSGYGTYGYQVGSGIFSADGCWDFEVISGPATMHFTLWVEGGSVEDSTPEATPAA